MRFLAMEVVYDVSLVKIQTLVVALDNGSFDVGYFWDYGITNRRYELKLLRWLREQVILNSLSDYGYYNATTGSGVVTRVLAEKIKPEHKAISACSFDLSLDKVITTELAYKAGENAYLDGLTVEDNPHSEFSREYSEWYRGYEDKRFFSTDGLYELEF
jgi:hypothetical protein